jgi:SdrD B-like domain
MKNFTAAMFSFYESVVSNLKQSQTVQHSEAESVRNNRANLFKNISTRNFLWGFYGVLSNLFKFFGGQFMSILKGSNNLDKFHVYLNRLTVSRVYLNLDKASTASRSLIGVLVASLMLNTQIADAQCTGTSVAGTVFRDFNLNGVKDNTNEIGLAGITVKAFNSANAQVGSTVTTAANGTYSITGLSGSVRVEFSSLPTGYVQRVEQVYNLLL